MWQQFAGYWGGLCLRKVAYFQVPSLPEGLQLRMRICGVASAFPKNYYSQDVIREALKSRWSAKLERPQILDRLHSNVGVQGRYLALPIAAYEELSTWGEANDAWIQAAQELGEQALCRA